VAPRKRRPGAARAPAQRFARTRGPDPIVMGQIVMGQIVMGQIVMEQA